MLTGYQLAYNGRENVECYKAGLDSATGLELTPIPCAPNGRLVSTDWGLPCSSNGISVTGFDFQKAKGIVKPRLDAIKVITVQDNANGGTYGRWLVPDSYVTSDFVAACCAGCAPLPAVTIPEPILFNGNEVLIPCVPTSNNRAVFNIPVLTGTNTTYTATGYATDKNGVNIPMSPATATGTTPATLAANMQTAWAAELGGGTFTAVGNTITYTGNTGAQIALSIAQS